MSGTISASGVGLRSLLVNRTSKLTEDKLNTGWRKVVNVESTSLRVAASVSNSL